MRGAAVIVSTSDLSGDTTNGDTQISTVCGGIVFTGPADVFTFTNGGGTLSGSIVVTPTSQMFDVLLALGDGANCAAAAITCDGVADAGNSGAAEGLPLSGLAKNKTYFLFVSSAAAGPTTVSSGPYVMTIGLLPERLQSFEVD